MSRYNRLDEIGVEVHDEQSFCWVDPERVKSACKSRGLNHEKFCELFGVQTCPIIQSGDGYLHALYAWDAEAVLERMISGKLTGSQLDWD